MPVWRTDGGLCAIACAAECVAKATPWGIHFPYLLSSSEVRLMCHIFICFKGSGPERSSHRIWTHTPVETHHNHRPLGGRVVVRGGTTSKTHRVGTSKQHKGKNTWNIFCTGRTSVSELNWWRWMVSIRGPPHSAAAVCCSTGQTYLVQRHGGIFLCHWICQYLQSLRLHYVIFQSFV